MIEPVRLYVLNCLFFAVHLEQNIFVSDSVYQTLSSSGTALLEWQALDKEWPENQVAK